MIALSSSTPRVAAAVQLTVPLSSSVLAKVLSTTSILPSTCAFDGPEVSTFPVAEIVFVAFTPSWASPWA